MLLSTLAMRPSSSQQPPIEALHSVEDERDSRRSEQQQQQQQQPLQEDGFGSPMSTAAATISATAFAPRPSLLSSASVPPSAAAAADDAADTGPAAVDAKLVPPGTR